MPAKNIFYAQSGGVTAVINVTACAVIENARRHGDRFGAVYAGRNGILGALREELIDTTTLSNAQLRTLRHTPGGAFGSCRYKLGSAKEDDGKYRRLLEVFRAHNIGYLLYNGGGDSQDTAWKLSHLSKSMDYPLHCIGIPKTVDNDLHGTDTCPGFGSAAKYIAVAVREAALDVASMCETSTRVFLLEVMGRHAGWLAAAGGLAGNGREEAPHLILFPEVPFRRTDFLRAVKARVQRSGYCVVVVSEGLRDGRGQLLSDSGRRDSFGHAQLGGVAPLLGNMISNKLGYKHHCAVADYLQRSARHIASATDVEQAYAVGRAAVELAAQGQNAVLPVIRRTSSSPYRWTIKALPLKQVANRERKLPASYRRSDGFGISAAARRYLAPLIAGEAYPPYADGLPCYAAPALKCVPRKLPPWQEHGAIVVGSARGRA